jgi:hypothetical protein
LCTETDEKEAYAFTIGAQNCGYVFTSQHVVFEIKLKILNRLETILLTVLSSLQEKHASDADEECLR